MLDSAPLLQESTFPAISRGKLQTVQVNLGYLCNLSCVHCHVNAGPKRTELMSKATIDQVLAYAVASGATTLDLTGGAPEMNPHFYYCVVEARKLGLKVIDRCNLVILQEPGYEGLAAFLAEHQVTIVASLPCYIEDNVDKQRGNGVFQQSLAGLKQLNDLGYGVEQSDLVLDLVFNPQGINLPPEQQALEVNYKTHLAAEFDVVFNQLYTIANMPIQRFGSTLMSKGLFDEYMGLLVSSYNASTLDDVMCREIISVDWQGYVYDCDFNQMLDLPLADQGVVHISKLTDKTLEGQTIATRQHCYGCTAGQGSSCGGALT
ncbi:MAG: radical SAM/Cys-rich domain protein [Piscirickettsiaceae bacterium]|jgi:radical SAM/Cys-rich protein|nr:radical SAM/Cys-rich domain protein [Piscirickettsiaceae bacterium]